MKISRFTPLGLLRLSSREPDASVIYRSLLEGFGVDKQQFSGIAGSYVEAWCYCVAIELAYLKRKIRRAGQQKTAKALENLPALERELGIIPSPLATLSERRAVVATRMQLPDGNARQFIERDLANLLGDDFIAYRTTPGAGAASPANIGDQPMLLRRPEATRKLLKLVDPVSFISSLVTVRYELPIISASPGAVSPFDHPAIGDQYVFDVGFWGRTDRVDVFAVGTTAKKFTAIFEKPHDPGVLGLMWPLPIWQSTKRHSLVVVTAAAIGDPEKRRIVNEYMARVVRSVSTWDVVEGTPTETTKFQIGEPSIGRRTIATVTL